MADIRQVYTPTALTGGTAGCLDAIAAATIADGSLAFTSDSSGAFHVHKYNINGTAATNSPTVIRPLDYATSGNWENQISPFGTQMPNTATLAPEGGIFGGNVTTSGNTLTISDYSCLDTTLKVQLFNASGGSVVLPGTINQDFYIFAVRTTSGVQECRAYTTYAGAAADTGIDRWRFLSYAKNDGSGVTMPYKQFGDKLYWYVGTNRPVLTATTTASYVQYSLSSIIPIDKFSEVRLVSPDPYNMVVSFDGTTDNISASAWATVVVPLQAGIWVKNSSTSGSVKLSSATLRR